MKTRPIATKGTVASMTLLMTLCAWGAPEAITHRSNNQVQPAVASSSNVDEHLVVWEDEFYTPDHDIRAQRVAGDGTRIGVEFGVATTNYSEGNPDLAYHPGAGEYLVVSEFKFGATDHDIKAQRIAEDGNLIDSAINITALGNFEGNPCIVYNPATQEYLVAWEHREGMDEFTHNDIHARRLAANGSPLGSPITVANGSLDESAPAVACTNAGQFLVVWQAKQAGSGEYDIHGQLLASDGTTVGSELNISTWEYDQLKPRVACNTAADEFLVVWEDHHWGFGADWDIYGQRLSTAGTPAGGHFGISWEGEKHRENPDVAYLPAAHEYLVTWEFEFSPTDHDVYCRRVGSGGSLPEAEIAVSTGGDSERRPVVSSAGDLRSFIVWEDDRNLATQGTDLYGDTIQLLMLSGRVFAGTTGDESTPLAGVSVELSGSNDLGALGTLISGTTTNPDGWFGLLVSGAYDYYNISEADPPGYTSVDATTVDGAVRAPNWIQYAHPLEGKTLTGNKFWDLFDPPPGAWAHCTPAEWVPTQTITCTIEVEDIGSGLNVSSAEYAYSTDSGATWSPWQAAGCTGTDGSLFEIITATDVSFGQDSGLFESNQIKFRIEDMGGHMGESGPYAVPIDSAPPEIIAGPTVLATTTGATISWETSEECNGIVRYGRTSGQPEWEEAGPAMEIPHAITLTGLDPSTTYHFTVLSTDVSGKTIVSRPRSFATAAAPDSAPPLVTLTAPPVCEGTVTLLANATDGDGVDRVEFRVDGALVFTSFSSGYQHKIDTTPYVNGPYLLTARAYDLFGNVTNDDLMVDFDNLRDITAPTVAISSPAPSATVTGKVNVVAHLTDDAGLAYAFLKVNGVSEAFEPIAGNPTSKTLTFEWDATSLTGNYTLTVQVFDIDNKSAFADVPVVVQKFAPQLPPKLKVSHSVTRYTHPHYFAVNLVATNEGEQAAENVVIQDYLTGFQPIEDTLATPTSANYEAFYDAYKKEWECRITSNETIPAMQSRNYTYFVVPVLHDLSAAAPSIGHLTRASYDEDAQGFRIHDSFAVPVAQALSDGQWKSLSQAYKDAVGNSNYIIATNPTRLFGYGSAHTNDVHDLLSLMAELGSHQRGVLGLLDKYDLYHLRDLVKPGGTWAKQMHPDYSKKLGGYLMIVGETAVVPASNTKNWQQHWSDGSTTDKVRHSDQRYADTVGGDTAPDLIVGRIVGDDPGELMEPIQTSLDVVQGTAGHGFDYSHALLFSGDGDHHDKFVKNVNSITSKLTSKGLNVYKMHREDFLSDSAALTDFQNHTSGRDFIYMNAHGNSQSCGFVSASNLATTNFGSANPIVFAPSCLTGNYVQGDLAEAFLQNNAAVYIGSTQVSAIQRNAVAGTHFCGSFNPSAPESVGKRFSETERHMITSSYGSKKYKFWVYEYNLYGDPKYGAIPATSVDPPEPEEGPDDEPPPTSTAVTVPAYTVTNTDGEDHVEIPGGVLRHEEGAPVVPVYTTSIDYPAGYEIQHVELVERSGLVTDIGLLLPIAEADHLSSDPDGGNAPPDEGEGEDEGGWFPPEIYDWNVLENPDGSTTLTIVMYPVYYDRGTTEIHFYPNYSFEIHYTESPVAITSLTTEKNVYEEGEIVSPAIEFENVAEARDIVFSALIRRYPTQEVVDGLQLRTLANLTGKAHFAPPWPTAGVEPGQYAVEAALYEPSGNLLDKKTEVIQVGTIRGDITNFSATPERFDLGGVVDLSMSFENAGTLDIAGRAVMRVQDENGATIQEFSHVFMALPPGDTVYVADGWDTTGALPGSYSILGYVIYNSVTTDPVIAMVTDTSTVGPIITDLVPDPTGGAVTIIWDSRPGRTYDVEFSSDLMPGAWITIKAAYPSGGASTSYVDPNYFTPGFYRVVELP